MNSWQSWLLYLHVLGAMVWIGGGASLSLIGLRARRQRDRAAVTAFAHILGYVGVRAFMPSLLIVLATGLAMALDGAGWSLSRPWILIGLGLFLIAFLIGAVYLSRLGIALERTVTSPDYALNDATPMIGRWLAGYNVILLVLLAAVWDMIFKPF